MGQITQIFRSRPSGIHLCGGCLFLFIFLFQVQLLASPDSTDPRERQRLMSLYNATDGPNWNGNRGWGEGDPCTLPNWQNVICTIDNSFVLLLNLGSNGLAGTLPPQLGFFLALFELSLDRNKIGGQIPAEISMLSRLEVLLLNANKLVGPVPDELMQLNRLGLEGGLNLSYNGLYTHNPDLDTFILERSNDDWKLTQTIAPAGIEATIMQNGVVELIWEPILFTAFAGRYRVAISTQHDGPYQDFASTPDKLTSRLILTDLAPGTTYHAVIFSETDPHPDNRNKVVSLASAEIEFSTRAESGFSINPGLNGSWFNAETIGQGFFIDVFPEAGELFVGWFTYGQESPPAGSQAVVGDPGHRWLTAQGTFQGNTADLTVNLTTGGLFDNAAIVDTNPVGTIELRFDDCENAVVIYELDTPAVSGEISLTRIDDSNVELCEALADGGVGPAE
jgi:hypothetical protein